MIASLTVHYCNEIYDLITVCEWNKT